MRQTSAAFAWIEYDTPHGRRVLTQWNRKWQAFNVIGGHREPAESFRECVVREITEELGLTEAQFTVSAAPIAEIEFSAHSIPADEMTTYTMQLFRAAIVDEDAHRRIEGNAENRWHSPIEIEAGRTADGRRISEVAMRFVAKVQPRPD
jgi:8-oxo-dGTP pyrophosphatase MutT (NUDIX family)